MKIKVLITLMGIFLFLFGFIGFFASVGYYSSTGRTGRFYNKVPMYGMAGIVVDSNGNIFFGAADNNNILVYSNTGEFLYRFSFNTNGGAFSFYIDSDDIVHVATARGSRKYAFDSGILISEGRLAPNGYATYRSLRASEYVDKDGNIYKTNRRSVDIYDENGDFMRNVTAKTPLWPFHPGIMFFFALVGICSCALANAKLATDIFKVMVGERDC